jgi:hypothetical protein
MRLASLSLLGALLISCAEDGGGDRAPENPALNDGGLVVEPDPMTNCPGSEPRVGEVCGPDITESTRCKFNVGECTARGMTYTETLTYCCVLGVWETCGGTSPCAGSEEDAAEPVPVPTPDAALPRDAGADSSPDAGTD